MSARKKRIDDDDPTRDLHKALMRLTPEQGPVARRNARADASAELRRLRLWVEAHYPVVRAAGKVRRKKRTPRQIETDLITKGWKTASTSMVAFFTECGVAFERTINFPKNNTTVCMLSPWMVGIWARVSPLRTNSARREVRRVMKSKKLRDAEVTRYAFAQAAKAR